MRLADDERGRVPFALIGVLLLVSAVAIATVDLDEERIDRGAALAGDRAEAAAETALRDAVRDAGERAAANPVITPADNEWGAILDEARPYRSYLELLVAIELRDRLDGQSQRIDDAAGTVELPPIDDNESAASAAEAVEIESAGRGMVEATVRDVSFVLRQDGQRVGTRNRPLTVNVTTPTLTLHERTATFQSKLNADSLADGTLNRGLTGGLWSLAWARGYGQYAGVPFENVIDNRHAELVTNLAVLDVQRSVFGHSDADAERKLADETAATAKNEGIGMAKTAFEEAALPTNASVPIDAPTVDSPDPEEQEVGVDETADLALADLLEERATIDGEIVTEADRTTEVLGSLQRHEIWEFPEAAIVRTAASIDAELRTETREHRARRTDRSPVPEPEWTRVRTVRRSNPDADAKPGSAPTPSVGAGWSVAETAERTVELTWTETVRYRNESSGRTRDVVERYEQRVDVGIALVDRPVERPWIPDAAEPGTDGELYESARERASRQLLADQGDADGVAEAVVDEDDIETSTVAVPEDADAIADAAHGEVADRRERLRDVSTTASPGHALTDDERPVAELAARIRDRSASYRGIPHRYDGLGHRATVALRSLYVDRVLARLDARAAGSSNAREDVSDKVSGLTELPGAGLSDFFEIGMDYARPDAADLSARDPAPDLSVTVDGDPSYLDTDAVADTAAPLPRDGDGEYHPMGARTMTVQSLPTDEITNGITEAIVSAFADEPKKVPLSVAAQTLRSGKDARPDDIETDPVQGEFGTSRTSFGESNLTQADLDQLHKNVGEEVDQLVPELARPLADEANLSDSTARDVVKRTFREVGGVGGMGTDAEFKKRGAPGAVVEATESGSLTASIADRAERRHDVSAVDADRARTRMRAVRDSYLAEKDSQVPVNQVENVGEPTRRLLGEAVGKVVEKADQKATDKIEQQILEKTRFSVLPTRGFPLAPVPTWWYVTANVWQVEVHGTYAGFTARADQGGPSGGGQVSYVRDGQSVHLDVDGDGRPETLGQSDRIRFYATSTVAVAVPRGGGGVGNENGGFLSKTDGWDPTRGKENACQDRLGRSTLVQFDACQADGDLEVDRSEG